MKFIVNVGLVSIWLVLLLSSESYAESIWLEGESPQTVSPSTYVPNIEDVGRPAYLSGGKWLHINIEAADVDKTVSADGIVLSYPFNVKEHGNFAFWNRIGYEKVRSSFDWRVDNGSWITVTPAANTVDVEELQTWNPVAWLPMGSSQQDPGKHVLQIRLQKVKDENGAFQKIQYASDALYVTDTHFYPNGPRIPGDLTALSASDNAAASAAFTISTPTDSSQTSTPLTGNWQIAPDDELVVDDRLGPIKSIPAANDLSWSAIAIPGDRNSTNPELAYVHRYFLRTKLDVPAGLAGRSFVLHLPVENMIATVFVNGIQCGWTKDPFAMWDCDITKAIIPGKVNELWVGIKDAFYGLADDNDVGHPQYVPFDFWHYNLTNQLDMPELSHFENGLLSTPSLITAGTAYTSDVFAIPSVKSKSLSLEITVHNPTDHTITVSVQNDVSPANGGPVEKSFTPIDVTILGDQDSVVTVHAAWANPKLWWPDSPTQYIVQTSLILNGVSIDGRKTKFGFREWGWQGANFTLNGIPFHGRADLADYGRADVDAVALWKKHGQTMERMWGIGPFSGLDADAALDFYDSHGIVVRRTGIFDGEGAAGFYGLTETVNGKSVANKALFDNWREQLAAWVKGQRNHPSIFLWSMENEITFINSKVFGNNPITDPEMKKASDLLSSIDPTRPQMTDGGNALLDESLPVYGGHYMEPPFSSLPEGAYDRAGFSHRQIWPITEVKPELFGEAYFLSGTDLGDLATVGGETAFVGKAESHPAGGLIAKILSEGYRWNDINFQFWLGGETDVHYNSWQPVAVLCRQWDSTFSSGAKVVRTLGIFNDSRSDQPITLRWSLVFGGKQVATDSSVHNVAPGTNEKFDVILPMPSIKTREDGEWTLDLAVNGANVFHDEKQISVLKPTLANGANLEGLAVYDPAGSVSTFLSRLSCPFTKVTSLSTLPASARVLLIGKDALTSLQSGETALAAYASAGRSVIVLEQKNPLKYQALPGEMALDVNHGEVAFMEDPSNPNMKGLEQSDFFVWNGDGMVYQNAYIKPMTGGKSIVECSDRLQDSALAQMTVGKGLMLVSQLAIGDKISSSAVAQKLLLNMLNYAGSYKLVYRPVTLDSGSNEPLRTAVNAIGVEYKEASDPMAAISHEGSVAIIDASPSNLKELSSEATKVSEFTKAGGWIVLNNVTPNGLSDYNKIVGVNHIIRPYHQEKVTWPTVKNPLTAGLPTSSIVLGSGTQIFNFASGEYPDPDAFSYIVDLNEVAPFASSSFGSWDKITNNYTMADGFWPLIINLPALTNGQPDQIPIQLQRPEVLTKFTYVQDLNYSATKKISLTFSPGDKISFDVPSDGDPHTFDINPPRTTQSVTLGIDDWVHDPSKQHDGVDLIGIDNIYLYAKRPANFDELVKPMLNIGGLVEYPNGSGGIVLCNVKFKDTESNPQNVGKKQSILASILRNLDAPFSGGKTIIAGASNLTYEPLDLSKSVNQYMTDQGWFGDKQHTFSDFPRGRQNFAGVTYNVYNFTTSPVPNVIMLGGDGVPGNLPDHVDDIPVGRKADALFFLQAARIDQRRNQDEVRNGVKYEVADYVVHYADGQNVTVPVYSEIDVDDYHEQSPSSLPGAELAWSKPYTGTDGYTAAYSMQWTNPRPDIEIRSLDFVYGKDRHAVPAVLAITAASAH